MASLKFPRSLMDKDKTEDPATAAILATGGADGVPAFALRYWCSGSGQEMPVFITWLLGVGRICLTVAYGRHALRDGAWHIDTGHGLRGTRSPLDRAQLEALRLSQDLQLRLRRSAPVSPALALPDMKRDRRIEREARRSRVPVLWDLERFTAKLAGAGTEARFRQPLERRMALEEISALLADSAHAGVGP